VVHDNEQCGSPVSHYSLSVTREAYPAASSAQQWRNISSSTTLLLLLLLLYRHQRERERVRFVCLFRVNVVILCLSFDPHPTQAAVSVTRRKEATAQLLTATDGLCWRPNNSNRLASDEVKDVWLLPPGRHGLDHPSLHHYYSNRSDVRV
jgi:hypothetical protein